MLSLSIVEQKAFSVSDKLVVDKKVLLVVYDPILASGRGLHEERGWFDPKQLTDQIISTIKRVSVGTVNYRVAQTVESNEWPMKIDGFRYNEETYNRCMSDYSFCHQPDDMDHAQMWSDLNICALVSSNQVDTIFLYGGPYFGFDEYAFKMPGDVMPHDTPSNYWFYQGRKKNIPDCNGKTVLVMSWNYERGLAEAIHSYGHWIENALALTVGRGFWDGCLGHHGVASDFDHFTCIHKDITNSTPVRVAGCGSIHFPPNGLSDYDYNNSTLVPSACDSWFNYPSSDETVNNTNCSVWNCNGDTQLSYLRWWMSHLPRSQGLNTRGNLNNWWKYIADFDNAIIEAKSVPLPGDLNGDSKVDIFDYNILVSNLGT